MYSDSWLDTLKGRTNSLTNKVPFERRCKNMIKIGTIIVNYMVNNNKYIDKTAKLPVYQSGGYTCSEKPTLPRDIYFIGSTVAQRLHNSPFFNVVLLALGEIQFTISMRNFFGCYLI